MAIPPIALGTIRPPELRKPLAVDVEIFSEKYARYLRQLRLVNDSLPASKKTKAVGYRDCLQEELLVSLAAALGEFSGSTDEVTDEEVAK